MKKIAVHLADGFEEIEAISIIDVLRRAGFDVTVVSMNKSMEVNGAHEITVKADALFEDLDYDNINMIVLPGGMPGAANLKAHSGLREQILNFNDMKKPLAAICAAPMVFGNLGLLKEKKATCYPGFEEELHGAIITGEAVEEAENIITGKGAGVAIKFALKIVEKFKGKDVADELATKMIAD
ncbi:DJ-1 family glyoxalase III [Draconibacterium sediminis]|uniref:Thiamine biosynthesis protein ThiJ n=1 Tax=Draconibacterium sediminis TaxID=1544798 RepID=A0A0D8JFQ5_9BACT|nr:DJ-1 family glyoxalase III [Draconibacterium sediminis]KJF45396.1 thiamine biosynthesis protein ThiJ [Draconibacterium sediminis]